MVDSEGNGNPETERGLILNSRILWTFSSLYIKDRDERFLSVADRAYSYIEDNFIDTVYVGAVYTVDNTGNWINEIKSIYANSFLIYGLSEYVMATVINSIALSSALTNVGQRNRLYTAIRMEPVGELYSKWKAIESMEKGEVAIISGGTGNPFFTTDTASALRGIEIEADAMLKGTRVDGVYTADPEKDPNATKFQTISFDEVYKRGLKVMDLTATTMCKENNLPIVVFNMDIYGNLKRLMQGENIGTVVK
jgi:uridylate kinase